MMDSDGKIILENKKDLLESLQQILKDTTKIYHKLEEGLKNMPDGKEKTAIETALEESLRKNLIETGSEFIRLKRSLENFEAVSESPTENKK